MVAKSCTTLVETLEIMGCLPSINHQLVQDFAGRRIPQDRHRKSGPSATFTTVIVRPPCVTGTVALKITALVKECMSVKTNPISPGFFRKIQQIYLYYTYKSYNISRTFKPTNETWLNRDSTVTVASSHCVVMRFARTFLLFQDQFRRHPRYPRRQRFLATALGRYGGFQSHEGPSLAGWFVSWTIRRIWGQRYEQNDPRWTHNQEMINTLDGCSFLCV